MPHFTLSSALMGAIPGAVFRLSKQNKERAQASIVHLGIAVFCGTAIVSWGLTPYFLHVIFGLDYRVIMPPRLVAGAIEIMTYSMVLKTVYSLSLIHIFPVATNRVQERSTIRMFYKPSRKPDIPAG